MYLQTCHILILYIWYASRTAQARSDTLHGHELAMCSRTRRSSPLTQVRYASGADRVLANVPFCPDSDQVLAFLSLLPLGSSDLTMDASNENPSWPRFGDATKEELDALIRSAFPKNTRVATSFCINVFRVFCQERRVSIQFETCTAEELNDAFCRFYKGLHTLGKPVVFTRRRLTCQPEDPLVGTLPSSWSDRLRFSKHPLSKNRTVSWTLSRSRTRHAERNRLFTRKLLKETMQHGSTRTLKTSWKLAMQSSSASTAGTMGQRILLCIQLKFRCSWKRATFPSRPTAKAKSMLPWNETSYPRTQKEGGSEGSSFATEGCTSKSRLWRWGCSSQNCTQTSTGFFREPLSENCRTSAGLRRVALLNHSQKNTHRHLQNFSRRKTASITTLSSTSASGSLWQSVYAKEMNDGGHCLSSSSAKKSGFLPPINHLLKRFLSPINTSKRFFVTNDFRSLLALTWSEWIYRGLKLAVSSLVLNGINTR